MPELQGLVFFPGVENPLRATYTLGHGVTPGSCSLEIKPQLSPIRQPSGTLVFQFGETVLAFTDCKIDSGALQGSGGGYVTTLTILDRRWKWAFGGIFGEYNRRNGKGKVIEATAKSPVELARLLLREMQEPETEANKLPSNDRPYVKWEAANPARELESLCQQFGRVVGLDVRGNLRIWTRGEGLELPDNPLIIQGSTAVNPPEKPDTITVFGAPTRFQGLFVLEAVGLDVTGSVVPLDQLSYTPKDGWLKETADFPNLKGADKVEARRRALQTVWRWFRIKLDSGLVLPPAFQLPMVTDLEQILPVSAELVQIETVNQITRRQQAKVYGVYDRGQLSIPINSNEIAEPEGNSVKYRTSEQNVRTIPYKGQFQLLEDFGIVVFDRQVLKWNRASSMWAHPDLYLTCSFNLRDPSGSGALHRYAYNYDTGHPKLNTSAEMIPKTDRLQYLVYQHLSANQNTITWEHMVGNDPFYLDNEAKTHAEFALKKYQDIESSEAQYAGLLPISPDGAIQQVTWEVSDSGATTRASRNCETIPYMPTERQRQLLGVLKDLERDVDAQLPQPPEVV